MVVSPQHSESIFLVPISNDDKSAVSWCYSLTGNVSLLPDSLEGCVFIPKALPSGSDEVEDTFIFIYSAQFVEGALNQRAWVLF